MRTSIVALSATFLLTLASVAQENHAPGAPGEISISEITAHSARISWVKAVDPDGNELVYSVWLRKRIEGIAEPWMAAHETRSTSLVWDGLSAGTVYEVKIAAWDGKVLGSARIRENAFVTLGETGENVPPTTPKGMEFSQISAHAVKIWWAASTDANGDPVTYEVSVRKRVEGSVLEWLPAKTVSSTYFVWEGLEGETTYDARVRASDGKAVSRWFVKELAFRTTPELSAPSKPGEITISSVTSSSARIAWGAATGPAGVTLVYDVQLRARIEGVLQEWHTVKETAELAAIVGSLPAATIHDVRVRAWAKGIAGAWTAKEEAFKTLALAEVNHAPSRPGALKVSDLTPFSVRLSWEASSDADGDAITYAVSLRKRVGTVAQAWSAARKVSTPSIAWDGLSAGTIYEVRVQAWDGKAGSDWMLKENAFQTPTAGDKLASFAGPSQSGAADDQRTLLVIWPDNGTEQVMETTDALGQWTSCTEVETDGTNNRALVPISAESRFFRTRK